ncbi:uncharacterized protein LOC126590373 [Malus sylvestris]|uniref:uncharacterized protein LOC126590373 n=1 Tax=Malus sylvestris TaxID=3752 RepID=UPI0021AC6940|nr:uncharacterized protein LOC126590373 [Malus sylvestris]
MGKDSNVGLVVGGVVTSTDTANHELAAQASLKLRIAALIFKAAYQFMEAKDSWEMNETNRTEEAISARYYCYRCHHVVTVDAEIKCPFCKGGFIQACEGVASLLLAMSSESELSESGSDGEGLGLSALSFRCPFRALLFCVGLYNSNSSGLATLGFGSQDVNNEVYEERHEMRALATSSEWILFLANLALEILSAAFDRVSSPRKPRYALIAVGNCGCTCLHLRAPSQWYKGKSCIEE